MLVVAATLSGCLTGEDQRPPAAPADEVPEGPGSWGAPLPDVITGLKHVADATEMNGGAGLYVHGDHAYVSSGGGFQVVRVSDPATPVVEGFLDEPSRDVDMIFFPNGTQIAVLSSGSIDFVDVTDPEVPTPIGSHHPEGAVHNVAVVPGTAVVYNSRSIDTPGVDIINASDPADPRPVTVFGDLTCHDITFHIERDRAYCAGIRETQIWDIADPEAPTLLTRIVNPAIQIHHAVWAAHDGDLLIIGDEFAGSTPAAYGCFAAVDEPVFGGTVSDPVGALWFYDATDESLPVPVGYLSVPLPASNAPFSPCTAHFGGVLEDEDGPRDMLVMGWRYSGTHLIDFSDPAHPRLVDTYVGSGDTWESRSYNGYVFTGNSAVGMEILGFEGQ